MTVHNLGYPRIGDKRQLKFALESYWKGDKTLNELEAVASQIRQQNLQTQIEAGIEILPANDFAFYDQVLNMSTLLGVIPSRFRQENYDIEVAFRMARGRAPSDDGHFCCADHAPSESKAGFAGAMKKWFGSNYHYIVPELEADTTFKITDTRLFDEVAESLAFIHSDQHASNNKLQVKPVLLGPISYLYLAENKGSDLPKLAHLPALLTAYQEILMRLKAQGIEWVQIDEPILGLELAKEWQEAFKPTYTALKSSGIKLLLATYFETLGDHLTLVSNLPVAGIHFDAVWGKAQLNEVVNTISADKVLSLGLVDGRNIWKTDLTTTLALAKPAKEKFTDNLWIAPSCSLLHVPVDLESEEKLSPELKQYLSFAKQKLQEVSLVAKALNGEDIEQALAQNKQVILARQQSSIVNNADVQQRLAKLPSLNIDRPTAYAERAKVQHKKYQLPLFPTTTIGSFPQTTEIRQARRALKAGEISEANYTEQMQAEIKDVVARQERIGIDVFVHGEPERNDMVEYFGELLEGYAFTQFGWVQSYGSRCVKPPIIYGDVSRKQPMTVAWSQYAQQQTNKIMKGMLTGAVTMLQWSFVRDDQPREQTCNQIALALRDEVNDLEAAGIEMIQIDEAALREGLPLKHSDWESYLKWAVNSFKITTSGVKDTTQIHTHMCYSEFNDIIQAVANMDADVITIETSKSQMKLLDAFVDFNYPNEIGPGVYDIHSPNIPTVEEMVLLIEKAAQNIDAKRLWVNPDCGLKTRGWQETEPALANMVTAAKILREQAVQTA